MYPFSPSLPFYPHEFSESAEPDLSSKVGDKEGWAKGLYFGTKDETPNSLYLYVTVNWREWGHPHFGKQNQKSFKWVEVTGPKWKERQERQCPRVCSKQQGAGGKYGEDKIHAIGTMGNKENRVSNTDLQIKKSKTLRILSSADNLWSEHHTTAKKKILFKNLTITCWAPCPFQFQCWTMFAYGGD